MQGHPLLEGNVPRKDPISSRDVPTNIVEDLDVMCPPGKMDLSRYWKEHGAVEQSYELEGVTVIEASNFFLPQVLQATGKLCEATQSELEDAPEYTALLRTLSFLSA